MNDKNIDKQMNNVRKQLTDWAHKAKKEYPGQLEDSVRHAVDRLDPAGLARVSEEVVATVTGNRKKARKARKGIEDMLQHAQKKAGTRQKSRGSGRVWVVLGSVAVIGAVLVLVIRRATAVEEYHPRSSGPRPAETAKDVDPDLGT